MNTREPQTGDKSELKLWLTQRTRRRLAVDRFVIDVINMQFIQTDSFSVRKDAQRNPIAESQRPSGDAGSVDGDCFAALSALVDRRPVFDAPHVGVRMDCTQKSGCHLELHDFGADFRRERRFGRLNFSQNPDDHVVVVVEASHLMLVHVFAVPLQEQNVADQVLITRGMQPRHNIIMKLVAMNVGPKWKSGKR